ncbi:dienelactone hydrolase family protein [Cohnella hashimotonis]|uniref:Acetylxylan esterase n=1 Tax=Cohnella hashimotonis TaxID=2826895 RepID=A0ABT6TEK2_9BACL|nr:acetylxylan esterase [Cohnella hashimotonis]MDI4645236.1 acetylxylan esterase [Cohnella hashimotonis]
MTAERGLPDVLRGNNGERIESVDEWRSKRRPEILALFRTYVYGREPIDRPASLTFETAVTPGMLDGRAVRKQVDIRFEGPGGRGTIRLLLFVPDEEGKGPYPAFLLLNNRGALTTDPQRQVGSPFWPAERIVARGYAAAVLDVEDADPDVDDGHRDGVHGIFDRFDGERPADAWATIAAWAWAARRAMDYLETDPDIDAGRVAVAGHSRGGKASLWAGALDERFALVVSNESGSTGAALSRGKRGETVQAINDRFPHWFNRNYKSFNGREEALPVDQHMLIAAVAPRAVYVASADRDEWADPASEYAALLAAVPVYRLHGFNGLGDAPFPAPESPLIGERMGYHLRSGVHDLTAYDWERFMDFADAGALK